MPESRRAGVRDWFSQRPSLGYLVIALLTGAFLFPFVRMVWGIGDEGVSLDGARRIIQGQLFARDFVEMVGPGAFWWPALFLKLFGVSIVSAHALLLLTGITIALLMFHLSRRIGGRAYLCTAFFTAIGIPLWPGNSYHWDATLLTLLAFVALIEWQRRESNWLLLLCGALVGFITLIIQHQGALLIVAVFLSSIIIKPQQRKKTAILLILAYLAVVTSAVAFYAAKGALGDLIAANYVWPRSHYLQANVSPYGYFLPSILSGIAHVRNPAAWAIGSFLLLPLAIVFAIPALLIAAAVFFRSRAFTPELLPFWICGIALWVAEMHKPDMPHLIWGSPILLILLFRFLALLRSRTIIASCALAALLGFAVARIIHPLQAHTRIQSRNGAFWSPEPGHALAFIQAHTRPGAPVFIYPYYSLYNFLSDTENPTRFNYFLYGYNTPQQFHEAVNSIESKRVRYVLWSTPESLERLSISFPAYHPPPRDRQIIEPYLESHYHVIGIENDFRILERNP
ncbi:MAG: hypothetical protein JOY62_05340 [Acidobacteriaceae bacterium]|nr:hypothetical protein [Acidobacteriaceae bacterium]MBV9779380.1 hypothetical protein [Acidobacteriaceae bacterium]